MSWRFALVVVLVVAGCSGASHDEPGTLRTMAAGDDFVIPRAGSGQCAFDYRSQIHLADPADGIVWTQDVPWVSWDEAVVVSEGRVFGVSQRLSGAPTYAFALDVDDGAPVWQRALDSDWSPLHYPIAVGDTVVVGDARALVGLDSATGEERWRLGPGYMSPLATAVGIVGIDPSGTMTAIDPSTGVTTPTTYTVDPESGTTLIPHGDRLLAVEGGRSIASLDPETGGVWWRDSLELSDGSYLEVELVGSVILAVVDPGGGLVDPPTIVALDSESGRELWRRTATIRSLPGSLNVVVIESADRRWSVLDAASGEERFSILLDELVEGSSRPRHPAARQPTDEIILVSLPYETEAPDPESGSFRLDVGSMVLALLAADGEQRWSVDVDAGFVATSKAWGDSLFVGWASESHSAVVDDPRAGRITVLDGDDGSLRWETSVRDAVRTPPIPVGDQFVVLSSDPWIFCD